MNLTLVNSWIEGGTRLPKNQIPRHLQKKGQTLKVGLLEGRIGVVKVSSVDTDSVLLEGQLQTPPPAPLPLAVGLAFSRPKMFRRSLASLVEVGVKRFFVFRSFHCEKSYESSDIYQADSIQKICISALEQGCDTAMPQISFHHAFKPFLQDILIKKYSPQSIVMADPVGDNFADNTSRISCILIGPESGFSKKEINLGQKEGLKVLSFSERQLRYETAAPFILGAISPSF